MKKIYQIKKKLFFIAEIPQMTNIVQQTLPQQSGNLTYSDAVKLPTQVSSWNMLELISEF